MDTVGWELLHFGEAKGQSPFIKPLWLNDSPFVAVNKLTSYRGGPKMWVHSQPAEREQSLVSSKTQMSSAFGPFQGIPLTPYSQPQLSVTSCCLHVTGKSTLSQHWKRRGGVCGGSIFPTTSMGAQIPMHCYDVWLSPPLSHPLEGMNKPGSSGCIAVDVITQQ